MPLEKYYGHGWWWEELPENAKQAAAVLGYTQAIWDGDEYSDYHQKDFTTLSLEEKRAALFIGLPPLIDKLDDLWWEDVDATTKDHAAALGYDEHKWDHDYAIEHLDVEHLYWKELTKEQQEAAKYFGYSEGLWNEDGQAHESFSGSAPSTSGHAKKQDEKKEEEPASTSAPPHKRPQRPMIVKSELMGGGGDAFDHGAHKHVDKISIFADGKTVHGITVHYPKQQPKHSGPEHGQEYSLKFRPGEFITCAKVWASNHVHSITLFTNKGTKVGPCGGEKGEEHVVVAPDGMVLCGFYGNIGKPPIGRTRVQGIGFKWGPNPRA